MLVQNGYARNAYHPDGFFTTAASYYVLRSNILYLAKNVSSAMGIRLDVKSLLL